ncbi:oligosaccharide flippase family protein [Pedobacter sp. AK017]|uniref:oligosaccharide flippase family protein n=1 Tax=Pedobacter sp. AK017 TaxID=2723073 RepID=UPI00160A14CB|nr:oligosaccharide flippase family protein [Pedobacter sp. AK017]
MRIKIKEAIGSEFGRVLLGFASSQLIGNLLKMIAGFIIVKLVSPDIYGRFTGHGIFLGYLSLVHFGVLNGLNRELPVEQGRGNSTKVKDLASVSLWLCNVISIPASIVLFVLSIYGFYKADLNASMLNFTYAFAAFFIMYNKFYLPILYRSNRDFSKLTKITLYSSTINIVSVILVFVSADIKGLCLRLILINIVEFLLLYYFSPLKVKAKWSYIDFIQLIKTGFPIFIVGNIVPLWDTIKNTIIFSLGGAVQFGFFALANVINNAVGIIPDSFSHVMYPKMAIAYGEGKSKLFVLKMNYKPMILLLTISVIFSIVGFALLPTIVKMFLPKYIPGIDVALWALFVPLVTSFSLINNYFNIYQLQRLYLMGILAGVGAGGLYIFTVNYIYGFNLEMFIQSLIFGMVVQNIICWIFIFKDLKKEVK